MSEEKFNQWCIVELMGRQVIAGQVSEQTIGGTAFIRVDVPAEGGQEAFTRFYGNGAIYAMTPVGEDVARMALRASRPAPVNIYIPELRKALAPTSDRIEADYISPDEEEDSLEDEMESFDQDDGE